MDECRGCYTIDHGSCRLGLAELSEYCPCTICLVKGVCGEECGKMKYLQKTRGLSILINKRKE